MTVAPTGWEAVLGVLCFCSRRPQRECPLPTRCDQGELAVPLKMNRPITEQPLCFVFPVHRESPVRLDSHDDHFEDFPQTEPHYHFTPLKNGLAHFVSMTFERYGHIAGRSSLRDKLPPSPPRGNPSLDG
jgi:hypothetical protein